MLCCGEDRVERDNGRDSVNFMRKCFDWPLGIGKLIT